MKKVLKRILKFLPKSLAHELLYKRIMGKTLNLKNPKDFNEKIQYLIVYKYGKKEADLADKYLVKQYVAQLNIKDLYIPKTYKAYTSVDDIKLDELPSRFVLKCNHGSGDSIICQDKNNFDLETAKDKLFHSLKNDFSNNLLEYHYSLINPVIIAEEYLDDKSNKNPLDYKFYCFNGKVESILVCSERDKKLRLDDFDLKWNKLNYTYDEYKSKKNIEKPVNLDKMIKIASDLSKNLPFVRIDLYNIDGKIYFGEFTFTPAAGLIKYYNDDALLNLGEKINLSKYE